jgi:hypothetical protein
MRHHKRWDWSSGDTESFIQTHKYLISEDHLLYRHQSFDVRLALQEFLMGD